VIGIITSSFLVQKNLNLALLPVSPPFPSPSLSPILGYDGEREKKRKKEIKTCQTYQNRTEKKFCCDF
jgi:hypothetical protein